MYKKSKLKAIVSKRHLDRRVKNILANEEGTSHTATAEVSTVKQVENESVISHALPSNVLDEVQQFFELDSFEFCNDVNEDKNLCSTEDSSNKHKATIREMLRNWAIKNKVSHSAVTDLLHLLHEDYPCLPLDCRTLLKTPRTLKKFHLNKGEFVHFNLKNSLLQILSDNVEMFQNLDLLSLCFNIDGLPVFHSVNISFWPILCLIKNSNLQPFVISIYCGGGKPDPLSTFLENFISELKDLLNNGIIFNKTSYFIQIHSFVCDAPARAYLKCIKSHTGYASCEKCSEYGTWINGRVIFKNGNAPLRTNESFRNFSDEDHHQSVSPLTVLPIDFIKHFPADYMHCICLGVMRKLLNSWVCGKPPVKLSARQSEILSGKLLSLKDYIPFEINRKPRHLSELARWKATEFRTFLLYLGPFVLTNVDIGIYEHFLLFHSAIFILMSSKFIDNLGLLLPKTLLNTFVSHCEKIYGTEYLIYNVHILTHITDDVVNFGALDNFSAFPFENHLGQIKRLINSTKQPLHQIHNRLVEASLLVETSARRGPLEFLFQHQLGPNLNATKQFNQFKKVQHESFALTIYSYSTADCYCLLSNGLIIQIHNILYNNCEDYVLLGKEFVNYGSFYKYPIDSKLLNIFILKDLSDLKIYKIKDIPTKCLVFPHMTLSETWISFPLIHTIL